MERSYFKFKGVISGKRKYEKQLKALIERKRVQDPFNKISLRHVCLEIYFRIRSDAYSLNNILTAYGIKNIEEAIDPSSSPVFETLGRLGDESYFYDGFGFANHRPKFYF